MPVRTSRWLLGRAGARFDLGGGDAGVDPPGLEVAGCDGAEAEDSSVPEVDTGRDGGAGADPGVFSDRHAEG
jgi:hypothetical protein